MIVIGWALGLFSPIINDYFTKNQHKREIENGLLIELGEIRYRLMCSVYVINSHFGTIDNDLLEWFKSTNKDYRGVYQDTEVSKAITRLLGLPIEEIGTLSKANSGGGLGVKKYETPFLDLKLSDLTIFDETFQNKILEIKSRLNLLNEEVETSRFYHEKTFDSLSDINRQIICQNLNGSYKNIAGTARRLADRIAVLKTK